MLVYVRCVLDLRSDWFCGFVDLTWEKVYIINYKKSFEIRVWRWSCRSGKTRRCRRCTAWSCLGPMNIPVSVLCGLVLSRSDEHTGIGIVRLGLVSVRWTYRYRLVLSCSANQTGVGIVVVRALLQFSFDQFLLVCLSVVFLWEKINKIWMDLLIVSCFSV